MGSLQPVRPWNEKGSSPKQTRFRFQAVGCFAPMSIEGWSKGYSLEMQGVTIQHLRTTTIPPGGNKPVSVCIHPAPPPQPRPTSHPVGSPWHAKGSLSCCSAGSNLLQGSFVPHLCLPGRRRRCLYLRRRRPGRHFPRHTSRAELMFTLRVHGDVSTFSACCVCFVLLAFVSSCCCVFFKRQVVGPLGFCLF